MLLCSCEKESKNGKSISYKYYNDLLLQTEKTIYCDKSLTQELLTAPFDIKSKDVVAALLVKCQILSFKGENVKCDSLAKIAMDIAKANNDQVGLYFANSFFSDKDTFHNKNKLGIGAYYRFYETTKTGDPQFHEEVVHDLINILLAAENYKEVKKYIVEQHKLAEQLNDSIVWYGYYSNKSIELFEHYGQDSVAVADAYIDKAIQICPKWKYSDYYIALSNKDWLKGHDDVSGIERNIAASVKYNYFDIADYTNIIGYYYTVGDESKCLYYFNLVEQKCIYNQDYDDLTNIYNHLSNLYMMLKKFDKALFYYKKKQLYAEKLGEQQTRSRIEELESVYQLKETNQLLTKQQQINTALVALAGVLLVALLLFWMLNLRRKSAAHQRYLEIIKKLETQETSKLVSVSLSNENDPSSNNIAQAIIVTQKTMPKVEEELIDKITRGLAIMEREEMFLKSDFKASVVAQKLGTNTNYLSQYFTQEKKKTFPEYTQELRINYVLNRLKNDNIFRKFTLQAIAEEIGYKNAATFVRIFKAQTDISPSFYIEEINNDKKM